MKKEIAKLLAGSSALPVLFIGSGLTRRYLDLPNWEGLLRRFCVYGKFGKVGYRGLRAEELYLYALGKSELEYDDEMILREAVPALHNGRSTLPVCRFVSRCQSKDCINNKVKFSLKERFEEILSWGEKKRIKDNGNFKMGNIMDYYNTHGLSQTLSKIPLIAPEDIEPDSLVQFLNKALEDYPDLLAVGKGHQSRSQFKKCISIWDWLKYSNAAKNQMNILKEN